MPCCAVVERRVASDAEEEEGGGSSAVGTSGSDQGERGEAEAMGDATGDDVDSFEDYIESDDDPAEELSLYHSLNFLTSSRSARAGSVLSTTCGGSSSRRASNADVTISEVRGCARTLFYHASLCATNEPHHTTHPSSTNDGRWSMHARDDNRSWGGGKSENECLLTLCGAKQIWR